MLAAAVALAAGLGAVARYLLDQIVTHRGDSPLPWGTGAVNVSGSLLLGLVTGLSVHHGLPAGLTVTLSAGFAGGYTTWSTWLWESLALAETGALAEAAANLAVSLSLGLAAAGAGFGLALL